MTGYLCIVTFRAGGFVEGQVRASGCLIDLGEPGSDLRECGSRLAEFRIRGHSSREKLSLKRRQFPLESDFFRLLRFPNFCHVP